MLLSDFSVFKANSVEHCWAPAVALLLYPEFRTGGSDGCPSTRVPVDGSEADSATEQPA